MADPAAPADTGHGSPGTSDGDSGTPLGVTLVSLLVALNGLLWIVWGYGSIYADPTPLASLAPVIGLSLVLLAWGLWRRNWIAWTLTTLGLMLVILLETARLSELTLGELPIVQLLLLVYLFARQAVFFERNPSDSADAASGL
ncbi:hypothetical protein C479_06986 [Halovivax asiaticus JCM 14624]|uniref:Uncharacterized protein n=1 Tax=Halovivax asiaticus JCM 14624 TaxID=1227490 RepID=M0BMS6_9EURY|nr:hypothetical protein [Halovivax asiaticus]ELZ11588.1 hypothetical protein C479_06986 [Halovivax asiaticus JCM 14624]